MKLFILMLLMLNTYVAIANDRIESSIVLSNSISMERREILKKVFERLESIEFNPETLSSSYKKMYGKNKDGLIKKTKSALGL